MLTLELKCIKTSLSLTVHSLSQMETDGYIEGTLGLVITEQDRAEGHFGYTKEEWESLTLDHLEPTLFCEHEDGTVEHQTGRKRDHLPVGTIKKTWVDQNGQMCIRADFYTTNLGQQMRQNVLKGNFNKLSIGYDAYNLGTKDKPYYKSNFRHVGICRIGADPSAIIQIRASMSSGEGAKQQMEDGASSKMDTSSSSSSSSSAAAATPTSTDSAATKKEDVNMSDETLFEKFKTMTREELAKKAAEQEAQKELLEELKAEKLARDQKRQEKLKVREQESRETAIKEAKDLAAHLGWSEELTMQNAPLFASKDENAKRIAQNFRDNAASIQKLKEETAQARKEAEDAAVVRGARQGYDDARKRGRYNNSRSQESEQDKKIAEDISSLVRGQTPKGGNNNDVWANIFSQALAGASSPSSSSSCAQESAKSSAFSSAPADQTEKKTSIPSWLQYVVRTEEPTFKEDRMRRDWAPAVEVRQSGSGPIPFVEIRQSNFGKDDTGCGHINDYINKSPEIVSLFFSNPDDMESVAHKEIAWNTWVKRSNYDVQLAKYNASSSSSSSSAMMF